MEERIDKKIANALEIIVKGKNNKLEREEVIDGIKQHLEKHNWPVRVSKESVLKAVRDLADGQIEVAPETALMDMVLLQTRKMPNITKTKKEAILKIAKIIEDAEVDGCDHDLGIAAFMHGGGFSPTFAMPELICKKCGLNVTLAGGLKQSEYGIQFDNENSLGILNEWAMRKFKNQDDLNRVPSAREITENPRLAYKNAVQWDKPIPLKITNDQLLQSKSGH